MVSNSQIMDNQRQQYHLPGPPPPPSGQGNISHIPPPPPRSYPGSTIPPPPPGPHPSTLPPGTVFGIPGGWQQTWGRSGLGQTLPPPPPMTMTSQNHPLGYGMGQRQPGQLNIPPPPPRDEMPVLSATFIPGGDSFGPGVGIPPLDDYSTYSRYDGYDPSAYAEQNFAENHYTRPSPVSADVTNREHRAASASSNRNPFSLAMRDTGEPISPGPPTATLHNPNPSSGRQRAHSAMISQTSSNDIAQQWPIDRILVWLAANGFSNDWQELFQNLQLEKGDFLDLGRGPGNRGNLGKMHKDIYPALARICTESKTGWDQSRERAEGKRLIKLIGRLSNPDGPMSASIGHRRRESGLTSASTDGTVEDSPHIGTTATPSTTGPEGSPGRPQFGVSFPSRTAQERSITLPVFGKQASSSSTTAESRHSDNLGHLNRNDYTRSVLNGLPGRGRHSPNLSSDSSNNLTTRQIDGSPNASPGLAHALPAQVHSNPNLPLREHNKTNSIDSSQKSTGFQRNSGPGNIVTTEIPLSGRFYENRRDGQDMARPDGQRTNSNEHQQPGKEHGKGFLSKFMRNRKHDANHSTTDDAALESPTSPANFRQMFPNLPFSKASANISDPALLPRPASASILPDGDGSMLHKASRPGRRYVFVTPDHWNYRLVDVTEVDSANSLRSLICLELGVTDVDFARIYTTEAGKTEHEEPLNDAMLLMARGSADASGSLKFYVQSPALSSISTSQAAGLGLTLSQRDHNTMSQPMLKSNSAGPAGSIQDPASEVALQKAAEQWRRETEKKQKAYLESRQTRMEGTLRGSPFIDFDSPRTSPYEEKKSETLVPHRKPPAAPSESNTLTKVNSLRMKTDHRSKASLDALKKLSGPISEEKKTTSGLPSPAQGIAAALAGLGKVAGAPAHPNATISPDRPRPASPGDSYPQQNTGRSSRSSQTWCKGNLLFNVPDYEEGSAENNSGRPQTGDVPSLRQFQASPHVSPATRHPGRPAFNRVRSYGPDFEFKETNVSFAPSPNPQAMDDGDDDSDDGLFAIPLAKEGTPKKSDQRPALQINTDHNTSRKSVAFKSPRSSGTGSSGPATGGDESASTRDRSARDSQTYSAGSAGFDSANSPEESRRPDSFHSDIWANRPAVENVVDHLDKFFPGVDLDKPYLEESGESGSPMTAADRNPMEDIAARFGGPVTFGTDGLPLDFERSHDDTDTLGSDESTLKARDRAKVTSVASRQMGKAGGLGRMKSIREVAQKRNDLIRGPSTSYRQPQAQASSLVRRKSTKMFGANIVQIKPQRGSRLSTLDPIPQEDIPTEDTPKRQPTFKIIRGQLIGKGTYGRVYLGMNANTGEFLAVKQVEVNQKAAAQDKDRIKEMVAALDQEIDTMQHLEHPNIVQYLGCERKEFSISIYLEYIPGGSVGSCLRKHGKFEESVVRSLTQQTLKGLAYLHQEGILHRDLKADNILLDLDGTCKISDFGISKKSDNIYGNDVTNSMQGSVFWMAPEVVRSQGQGYSAKVDIWSLGCVVLEMFAGKRPWSREEAIGAIFKLGSLQQAPPIPEDVSETASVDGLNFMYDCFQVNPSDRPTAKTLLQHSTFCVPDMHYNFFDTHLAAKLRFNADLMPGG